MSSMIKKKGALSFKPKAPQARRPAGAAPPSQPSSTPRPSVDRQSQTPAASTTSAIAASSPPVNETSQTTNHASNERDAASQSTRIEIPLSTIEEQPITSGAISSTATVTPSASKNSRHSTAQNQISLQAQARLPLSPPPTYQEPDQNANHPVHLAPTVSSAANLTAATVPLNRATAAWTSQSGTTNSAAPNTVSTTTNDGDIQAMSAEPINVIIPAGSRDHAPDSSQSVAIDLSTMGAGESIQAGQLVPVAALNIDGTSGTILTPATGRKKQPTKRRRLDEDDPLDVRPSIEVQVHKRARIPKALLPKKPRKKRDPAPKKARKKRAETPDDAEEQEIDHSIVKMSELCKDPRIGRRFSKHAEIKKRDVERKTKAKLLKDHPELVAIEEGRATPAEDVAAVEQSLVQGAQMRIVDGQIVLDDRTTLFDRHAQGGVDIEMEVVEENDFTRITNSGTYMKTTKAEHWTVQDYELFYTGIRMFGTDFQMISEMFVNRNRRQIKLKFNKEEKECPEKIDAALRGEKVEIDFEEYKGHTGLHYETLDDLKKEREALQAEHDKEFLELQEAEAASNRNKRAEIHGTGRDQDTENENEGAIQGGKASAASRSKKKGTKKKQLHATGGGGEVEEIVGEV